MFEEREIKFVDFELFTGLIFNVLLNIILGKKKKLNAMITKSLIT